MAASFFLKFSLSSSKTGFFENFPPIFSIAYTTLIIVLLTIVKNCLYRAILTGSYFMKAVELVQIKKLRAFLFISVQKVSYICLICGRFYLRIFPSLLRRFTVQRRKNSGAMLILLAFFVPIFLAGIRYTERMFERRYELLKEGKGEGRVFRKCDPAAVALAVARNYNPGLTLGQQKDALYKIADHIYNTSPCFQANNILTSAIPGIVSDGSNDVPFSPVSDISKGPKVKYETKTKHIITISESSETDEEATWNPHYILWLRTLAATNPASRKSVFDEVSTSGSATKNCKLEHHDITSNPHANVVTISDGYPTYTAYNRGVGSSKILYTQVSDSSAVSEGSVETDDSTSTYTVRSTAADSGAEHVKLSIDAENDRIKAEIDGKFAYAVPAQCNVHVVLAVPTNGAACNVNNRDMNSSPAGSPSTGSAEVSQTPIYQIGQACRDFIKSHFYHTHGVHMSLIPYSGRLAISPERFLLPSVNLWAGVSAPSGTRNYDYVRAWYNNFLYEYPGFEGYSFYDNPGIPSRNLMGTSIGVRNGSDAWSVIMFGGDRPYEGSLFSNVACGSSSYSEIRNCFPYTSVIPTRCRFEAVDWHSKRCIKNCTTFCPNPYHIIEPTADLVRIYEMCGALYPFGDLHNLSNFLFLPLEWSGNFFQSWTACANTVEASSEQLSNPAKADKKAIILFVNKPDHFEHRELTYLGFDDDSMGPVTLYADGGEIKFNKEFENDQFTLSNDKFKFKNVDGKVENTRGPVVDGNKPSDKSDKYRYGHFKTDPDDYCSFVIESPYKLDTTIEVEPANITVYDTNIDFDISNIRGNLGVGPINSTSNQYVMVITPSSSVANKFAYSRNGIDWTNISESETFDASWGSCPVYGGGNWFWSRKGKGGIQFRSNLSSGDWNIIYDGYGKHSPWIWFINGKLINSVGSAVIAYNNVEYVNEKVIINGQTVDGYYKFTGWTNISNFKENWNSFIPSSAFEQGVTFESIYDYIGIFYLCYGDSKTMCYHEAGMSSGNGKFSSLEHFLHTSSDDGTTWTSVKLPDYQFTSRRTGHVLFDNDRYYMFGFNNDKLFKLNVNDATVSHIGSTLSFVNDCIGVASFSNKIYIVGQVSDDSKKYCVIIDPRTESWIRFTSGKAYTEKQILNSDNYFSKSFTITASQYPEKDADGMYRLKFDLAYARLIRVNIQGGGLRNDEIDFSPLDGPPINMALQNNLKDELVEDNDENCRTVTKKWCEKLKADNGESLKIYVVKYRAQAGDYAYIEKCATDTGGKVKTASNAAGLKTVLDEIAAELKSWGEYQAARVVN